MPESKFGKEIDRVVLGVSNDIRHRIPLGTTPLPSFLFRISIFQDGFAIHNQRIDHQVIDG